MKLSFKRVTMLLGALALVPVLFLTRAHGSDHADTPAIKNAPGADLTDVFLFPSPTNSNNIVMVMCVHPLIGSGNGPTTYFDPNVLYQFKIDNSGDSVEDLVLQAQFGAPGPNQPVSIAFGKPSVTGIISTALPTYTTTGTFNTSFSPTSNVQVFAGPREDPFFFDLNQFFTILPDRATPVNGIPVADPNVPKATSWRAPGVAQDFLSANKLNVLAIVVELPKNLVQGSGTSKIGLWCTTSVLGTSRKAH